MRQSGQELLLCSGSGEACAGLCLEVRSFPMQARGSESSHSAWWQGLLLAEPSSQPQSENIIPLIFLGLPPFPHIILYYYLGDTFTDLLGRCHSMCAEVSFHTLGIKLKLSFWWQLNHLTGLLGVGLKYGLHFLILWRAGMTSVCCHSTTITFL